jgi:ABC-type transport system involved in cytochrome c biogenesis permease subunit
MSTPAPIPEVMWLWAALAGYSAGAVAAWRGAGPRPAADAWVLRALWLAVALMSAALVHRWLRVGYGPFLTLFEVLLSNLFSLGLFYAVAYWRVPALRPGAVVVLPVLLLLGAWSLSESPAPSQLPATYDNPWLWVHVGAGKLFLGACLAAAGVAAVSLAGGVRRVRDPESMEAAAWRLMAFAFVFQTVMIVAGAAWARDAWGRFWSWDPLETWALVTWLAAAALLHLRVTWRIPPALGWCGIVTVFVLAVLTFLGVPFLSVAAHRGIV